MADKLSYTYLAEKSSQVDRFHVCLCPESVHSSCIFFTKQAKIVQTGEITDCCARENLEYFFSYIKDNPDYASSAPGLFEEFRGFLEVRTEDAVNELFKNSWAVFVPTETYPNLESVIKEFCAKQSKGKSSKPKI